MILSEFDIKYVERKEIKGKAIADQLTDALVIDNHPLITKFLDESIFNMESIFGIYILMAPSHKVVLLLAFSLSHHKGIV